jgi:hypothetical protein
VENVDIDLLLDGAKDIPNFITFSKDEINIVTTDLALAGSYNFTISAELETNYPKDEFEDTSVKF